MSIIHEQLNPHAAGGLFYEVIVTDDGSKITAEAMVQARYPWARWIEGPCRGPAANRNFGASHARGDWLAFTDDDCLPDRGWLFAFVSSIQADVPVLEGKTSGSGAPPDSFSGAPVNEHGGYLWSCNLFVERIFFRALGGFDERFPCAHLEDVDLRLRIQDRGEKFVFVPNALIIHPWRPVGSIFRQALGHESSFHLASKRGIKLKFAGLSPTIFLISRYQSLSRAHSVVEAGLFLIRTLVEAVLILGLVPIWSLRYRDTRTVGCKSAGANGTRVKRRP